MRTILIRGPGVPDYDVTPDATVNRLGQVLDVLDTWSG
jgi:hypothetical protein